MNRFTEKATRLISKMYSQAAIAKKSFGQRDGESMMTIFLKIMSDPRLEIDTAGKMFFENKEVGWIDFNRGIGWIDDKAYESIPDLRVDTYDEVASQMNMLLAENSYPEIITANEIKDSTELISLIDFNKIEWSSGIEASSGFDELKSMFDKAKAYQETDLFSAPSKQFFKVEIEETLVKEIYVSASDAYEARQIVEDKYENLEIILTADDFYKTDFIPSRITVNEIPAGADIIHDDDIDI